ncbi:MAG: primosomal protein N' [Oscillatoriales cyanobacterium C42_A2020_001]|nr:primosomal protein N' [Leptolyngbyaceae cyanobacterium C42_A2020_001]
MFLESGASDSPALAITDAAPSWVEALVDCPGAQGAFTYRLPPGMVVQPGDILSVPFGAQQVGAIAIRCTDQLTGELDAAQIRSVEAVIQTGFFPRTYWQLLNQVADYYCTPLMQVVRVALPPGLLARSQRRVRLLPSSQESMSAAALSTAAQQVLAVLRASKTGDYSWQYLQRQVAGASRGLHELIQAGWVEHYLEPPSPVRPKQRQAVTLTATPPVNTELSLRQQEIVAVLRRQGGEAWLAELLQQCQTSTGTLKTLAQKGYLVMRSQEVLRTGHSGTIQADAAKRLTAAQTTALAAIQSLTGFREVLLHGVTGSGKTEVYLQAIAPMLEQGQSTLVLVPEIGLTPQLTDRFRARFGDRVQVYHSALSEGERYDTWRQMLRGEAQVVIGTRSAIFAPLPHLGLIILDEEHDSSLKQEQPAPCYHARTVARWRARLDNCPLVLGSATPSLETWIRSQAAAGRRQAVGGEGTGDGDEEMQPATCNLQPALTSQSAICNPQSLPLSPSSPSSPPSHPPVLYLSLPTRVHAQPLPAIEVVDMRQELHCGNRSMFSRALQQALRSLQDEGQQGILFMNRRGHSTFVSCRSCGYVVTCPHCDVSLTYHQPHEGAMPTLRCHYCNHIQLQPQACPSCESSYFKHFGSGTQRVVQELAALFPSLRIIRFDSDTTRTKGAHRALLTRFAHGEADLLVGTQMLTKGIDLPQVTLVGIVAADGLLHFSDYSASERTFQTLTQVAGRCGRGDRAGRVILQTYSPDDPVIQAVQRQDYAAFAARELHQRQALRYPPYGRLILLRFASPNPVAVQTAAERVADALAAQLSAEVERLGPAPAPVLRIANRYRWQLLLKLPVVGDTNLFKVEHLRSLCPSTVSLLVDIDPISMA